MRELENHPVYKMSLASVYRHYLTKVEKKGRTRAELDEAVCWLTGFDAAELAAHLEAGTSFEDLFAQARLNPAAGLVTGVVCGVRVEEVPHPLMRKLRIMDKLVDELAKGRPMDKVLRRPAPTPTPPPVVKCGP